MYLFLQISCFLYFSSTTFCNPTIEYYKKLIAENTEKALHYTFPKANEEFRRGYESSKTEDFGTYDFIIVGAGSAGSVLATRLSEISSWKILLLEAGGEENDFNAIPGMFPYLPYTEMNWGYFSTPQKNCCLGMMNQQCDLPQGKAVSGSSAINYLEYVRGNPEDYNKWEKLGNRGWSYQDVLPHFTKSENSQVDGDAGYHGKGGFWNVEYPFPVEDNFANISEACLELDLPVVDYNGRKQIGASRGEVNVMHGRRQSLGKAFLDKARHRKNLKLVIRALVTKILIDKASKKARGVEFVKNDKKFIAKARKEVILSAGAYNSPQLLMLSGIGPKKHLVQIGIEVIEDLPVGEGLAEHPYLRLGFHSNLSVASVSLEQQIEEYVNGTGILTNPSRSNDLIFIRKAGYVPENVPMLQYFFFPPEGEDNPIAKRLIREGYMAKSNPKTDFQIRLFLLHPKSRGKVTLQSSNPIDFPNVDVNCFSDREDVDNMIEGIKFISQLLQTETFKRINSSFIDIPACADFEKLSHEFWECASRRLTASSHPCGTTRMGWDKQSSVVDNDLRVHGIGKLRVVDAGIFPSTISGNLNAPTVMVAEKISDSIKKEYNQT